MKVRARKVFGEALGIARLWDHSDASLRRPAEQDLGGCFVVRFCGVHHVGFFEEGSDELDFWVVELDPAGGMSAMSWARQSGWDELANVRQGAVRRRRGRTIVGRMSSMQ